MAARKKKDETQAKPAVTHIPLPVSESALVIDLPDGQKLVVGKLTHGTVIEVATWRGTGRPDSRTNRMMLGMTSAEIEAELESSAAQAPTPKKKAVEVSKNISRIAVIFFKWLFDFKGKSKPALTETTPDLDTSEVVTAENRPSVELGENNEQNKRERLLTWSLKPKRAKETLDVVSESEDFDQWLSTLMEVKSIGGESVAADPAKRVTKKVAAVKKPVKKASKPVHTKKIVAKKPVKKSSKGRSSR